MQTRVKEKKYTWNQWISMTKSEILAALTASGEINVFRSSPNWQKAFELYNATHGGHKSMNCGSCYRDVKNWLQS